MFRNITSVFTTASPRETLEELSRLETQARGLLRPADALQQKAILLLSLKEVLLADRYDNTAFVARLKEILETHEYQSLCHFCGGEDFLNQNARRLLQIRSFDGLDLVEQLAAYCADKARYHTALSNLAMIPVHERRIHFNQPGGQRWLREEIERLNKEMPEDVKGASRKEAACQAKLQEPISFNGHYRYAQEILPTDSGAYALFVNKMYQLQDLQGFLNDPWKGHDFIRERFLKMDPFLRQLFGSLVWIAEGSQPHRDVIDEILNSDCRRLLHYRNALQIDCITYLIRHYENVLTHYRVLEELKLFSRTYNPSDLGEAARNHLAFRSRNTDPRTFSPAIVLSAMKQIEQTIQYADDYVLVTLRRQSVHPDHDIPCGTRDLLNQRAGDTPRNSLHVTLEYRGIASVGGLASAVQGMTQGLPGKTRVIMPFYEGDMYPHHLKHQLKESKHTITHIGGRVSKVFTATIENVKFYFIQDAENFTISGKNLYAGPDGHKKWNWAVFQSAAADLVYQLGSKVDILHVHDSQTALIPAIIKARHFHDWQAGRTPAAVFTYHNNLSPQVYAGDNVQQVGIIGLPKRETNSFVEGLVHADMVTTVSETYARETQTPLFGNGMEGFVREAAFQHKLVGIVNGTTNGWDISTDWQLGNLCIQPTDDIGTTAMKLREAQRAICARLGLDPQKPIILYVGRYDSHQKGIDKLPLIMEEVTRLGGQFVCIGAEPDEEAARILREMQERNNPNARVIIDRYITDGNGRTVLEQQSQYGSLLRMACTMGIFPSICEPCGLVQGELHRFGKKTIVTRAGGFIDTVKEGENGFFFERALDWKSAYQDQSIRNTIGRAMQEANAQHHALHHGDPTPYIQSMRRIIEKARQSTWTTTPDASPSPIEHLRRAYERAIRHLELRSHRNTQFDILPRFDATGNPPRNHIPGSISQ